MVGTVVIYSCCSCFCVYNLVAFRFGL